MRTRLVFMLSFIILLSSCGNKAPSPRYAPESKEYTFFKTLADTMDMPILNPAESNELVRTNKFSVWTSDIMPALYLALSQQTHNIYNQERSQFLTFVHQAVKQEGEKRLLLTEAADLNIKVDEDSVKSILNNYYSNSGGEEQFIKNMTTQGYTVEQVNKDIRENLIIQKYLNEMIYKNADISETDIIKTYEEPKSATVRHILMMTQGKSEAEKMEIHSKITEVLDKAKSGEDFAGLAKQYSEDPGSKNTGGLYEKFAPGAMVKPFDEASFSLPIGSISELVETQYGYHIIKIIDREMETRPLEEVREEIKKGLVDLNKQELILDMVKSLKEKYQYQELFTG